MVLREFNMLSGYSAERDRVGHSAELFSVSWECFPQSYISVMRE